MRIKFPVQPDMIGSLAQLVERMSTKLRVPGLSLGYFLIFIFVCYGSECCNIAIFLLGQILS